MIPGAVSPRLDHGQQKIVQKNNGFNEHIVPERPPIFKSDLLGCR
jgi:hypothetical protein